MDDIAQALMEVAEALMDEKPRTADTRRPWSPRVMGEWVKTVKAPVNALGHEWKKVSTALKNAERSKSDRQEAFNHLLDARDALDAVRDYARMANDKILGALTYVDMAEE